MLSLSNASLLLPPALSGAEGEAEGYSKTIGRPAASTLPKTGTGQAPSAQVLGQTRRARAAGISPTKRAIFFPAYRTSMYVHNQYKQNVPRGTLLRFVSDLYVCPPVP